MHRPQWGKFVYKLLTKPHKHLHHRKQKNKLEKNKRLTAPLNTSKVPVSNTVLGRSFHTRVWAGRKHRANWDVLHLDTSNSNG